MLLCSQICAPFSRFQQKLVAPSTAPAAIGQSVQRAGFGNAVVSDTHFTYDQ